MFMKTIILVLASAALMSAQGVRSVVLAWNHPDNPPTVTFNIYRSSGVCPTTQVPFPTKINTAPISAKTYTDVGVAYGTYCYQATAVGGGLESGRSNDAPAAVAPVGPTGLQTTSATATITVSEKGVLAANLDVRTTQPAPAPTTTTSPAPAPVSTPE